MVNINLLNELLKDKSYMNINDFRKNFYNVKELEGKINLDECIEVYITSQELLIYALDENSKKCIKYGCMYTNLFNKNIIQNCYSKDKKEYEYNFDKIYKELAKITYNARKNNK